VTARCGAVFWIAFGAIFSSLPRGKWRILTLFWKRKSDPRSKKNDKSNNAQKCNTREYES
jgi:hypothetical protein